LDSFQFKQTLIDFFKDDAETSGKLAEVDWDAWFYGQGFPPKPDFDTSMADVCFALADKWEARSAGKDPSFAPKKDDVNGLSANQIVVFLERVQLFLKPLTAQESQLMGSTYDFLSSKNAEILARYFKVGLMARDKEVLEATAEFLGRIGRMKFVRPLYRDMVKMDRVRALKAFEENKDFYHPICRNLVQQDLYGK